MDRVLSARQTFIYYCLLICILDIENLLCHTLLNFSTISGDEGRKMVIANTRSVVPDAEFFLY